MGFPGCVTLGWCGLCYFRVSGFLGCGFRVCDFCFGCRGSALGCGLGFLGGL